MKDLYNIIKESLFDEEEQLDNIDMVSWLSKQEWPYVVGNVKNGKVELDQLRIISEDIPNIPEWVKFGNVKDLQLYMSEDNYDCSKLPEMENIDFCFINADRLLSKKTIVDAGGLKAGSIDLLYVNLSSSDCISLPKCSIDTLYIGHPMSCTASEYRKTIFDPNVLKGMKFKKLIIGDSLITGDAYMFEKFWSNKTVYKDDPEYDRIKTYYDITKNLYIKHDRYSSSKYHKVKQTNDGFEIAKQGYVLK
jgi:hypothetical protein